MPDLALVRPTIEDGNEDEEEEEEAAEVSRATVDNQRFAFLYLSPRVPVCWTSETGRPRFRLHCQLLSSCIII